MKYAVLIEPSVIPCAVHPLRISPVEWIECKCRSCPLRIIIIAQRQDWSTYAYLALFSDSRLISMLIYQENPVIVIGFSYRKHLVLFHCMIHAIVCA
jgi:hypothetical protein